MSSDKRNKPKRRFYSASQVREEISRYQAKARKLIETAVGLESRHNELLQGGSQYYEDAVFAREKAKKARRSAFLIEEKKLPYLKQKLSEIMTRELPGVESDGSVPS